MRQHTVWLLAVLVVSVAACANAIGLSRLDFDRDEPTTGSAQGGGPGQGGAGMAGGAGGAGAAGTGGFQSGCATTVFEDDFEDGTVGIEWNFTPNMGSTVQETGGSMVATMPPGTSVTIALTGPSSLIGREITLELADPGDVGAWVLMELYNGTGDTVYMRKQDDRLVVEIQEDGPLITPLVDVPFDAEAHRWWRIRHEPQQLVFETSSDGTSWPKLFAHPHSGLVQYQAMNLKFPLTNSDMFVMDQVAFAYFLFCEL